MTIDVAAEPLVAVVRGAWSTARGTIVVPAGFHLTDVTAQTGTLSAQVTDPTGARFGIRVPLPKATRWEGRVQGGEGTSEHWALWSVIVPLMAELETDAARRLPPDADGVRWVTP
ncbi:hypothetical protein [Zhihengliuella sp. ISTPL4]|uniref:hypothetical protein n=1 Tax=Zhihengliuella sp. ISTPL4 TaxID=2058657 RepID=UPI000C7D2883|nr:hypothetical protein [Zhihengliuella sp. ISTPL4]